MNSHLYILAAAIAILGTAAHAQQTQHGSPGNLEGRQATPGLPTVGATSGSGSGTAAGPGNPDAAKAARSRDKRSGAGAAGIVVLFPAFTAVDAKFSNGCWAQLFGDQHFTGDVLTLAGPGDFAALRTSYATVVRKWDSIAVGPKTTFTVYDNENYTQPVATFKPGQRVADLDDKLGLFENIRSLRLACGK